MGKKNQKKVISDKIITIKQQLRHSSNRLERHIFNKNTNQIKALLNQNLIIQHVTYHTHNKYLDLVREINQEHTHKQPKRQQTIKNNDNSDSSSQDSVQLRRNIHKQQSLQSSFEQLLDKSKTSYEKTYELFKNQSLLKRYGHLVGKQSLNDEQMSGSELNEEQRNALNKIKALYRRYRVSNMYKCSLYSKISKNFVENLIRKGCLKQSAKKDNQVILSLIS